MKQTRVCSQDSCTGAIRGLGLCSKHYDRQRATGNPNGTTRCPPGVSIEEKIRWHGWQVTETGCWEWSGRRNKQGYGALKHEGRYEGAHRWAYRAWRGDIPDGLLIRHHCDNPPCINPEHIDLGTVQDNAQDALERGGYAGRTGRAGEANTQSSMSDQTRRSLRADYATGTYTYDALAEKYGTSRSTAWYTVRRWLDIEEEEG